MTTATNNRLPLSAGGLPDWVEGTVRQLRAAKAPIDARQALAALGAGCLDVHLVIEQKGDTLRCLAGGVRGVADATILSATAPVDRGSWVWGALQGHPRAGAVPPDPSIDALFEGLRAPRPKWLIVEPIRYGARVVGAFIGGVSEGPVDSSTASGIRRTLAAAGRLLRLVEGPPRQETPVPIASTSPANPQVQQIFESSPEFEPVEPQDAAHLRADAALAALTAASPDVEFEFEDDEEGGEQAPGLVDLARSTPTPPPAAVGGAEPSPNSRQIRVQITPTPSGPARQLTPSPARIPAPSPDASASSSAPASKAPARRIHLTPTPAPPSKPSGRVVSVAPPNSGPLLSTTERLQTLTPRPGARPTAAQIQEAISALDLASPTLNAEAVDTLRHAGPAGLDALVSVFPGHLRLDRYAAGSASRPASEHSHIIAATLIFGEAAAPALAQLADHMSPEIRYYAVLTLGALGDQPTLGTVANARLLDKDSSVREVTLHVLDRLRAQPIFETVVSRLRRALLNDRPAHQRSAAEALGLLRATDAWPELLKTLPAPNIALSETVHRALCSISWQDYGRDVWKWQAWFDRHQNQPRVEWLLDGMMSEQRMIRAGAFRELIRLTRQNYGYMVDAPPAQRRQAVEKWLKWWNLSGRGRFAAYR